MAIIYGCDLPEGLWFDVERDVWVRLEEDGLATLGMTDPAQARCGRLVFVRFKAVGRLVERGKSLATIESAKWVGPFPAPLTGEIVATNQETFARDVLAANKDPYGRGWLVKIRPTRLEEELPELLTGPAAVAAYQERIEELNLTCFRCVDGEEPEGGDGPPGLLIGQ